MLRVCLFLLAVASCFAQREGWTRPYPAHKIAGNLYYVGTEDLACFLIATPEGHILINTGLADSVPLIRTSMQSLGFKLEDIKILLTMQAHFDHTAGLAEIQKPMKARMYATEGDAAALEDGGKSDPALKSNQFAPIKVDRLLKNGDTVRLGGTELRVVSTPGHSRGSVSYAMNISEGGRTYQVLIANMGSVVMSLVKNPKYPGIIDDFAQTFRVQKSLTPDIWVAAHASHYDMQRKHKSGSFVDPQGYKSAVERFEKLYLEQLARERAER